MKPEILIDRFIPPKQRRKSELYAQLYDYEKQAVLTLADLKYKKAEKLVAEKKLDDANQLLWK